MRVLVGSRIRRQRINKRAVAGFAEFVMRRAGCPGNAELSVLFVGRAAMRSLNRRYRGEDRGTDVLAFGLGERGPAARGAAVLGDVVISVDAARRQARRWKTSLNREILLYLVHGILHLRGFDDTTAGAGEKMERTQHALLREALKKGRWTVIS